jgi:hypothetical protein
MKDLKHFKRLHEAEEDEDITADITDDTSDEETSDEDTDTTEEDTDKAEDKPEEEDEEESNEKEFTKMFDDQGFVDAFKNAITQYISEKLLDDEFNSFTVLPLVETEYKDETYSVSIDLETAATININDDGKVVQKDIPEVDVVKFKTPMMDNLAVLEDEISKETISLYVMEAIEEIKKVPR